MPVVQHLHSDYGKHQIRNRKRQAQPEHVIARSQFDGQSDIERVLSDVDIERGAGVAVAIEPAQRKQIQREPNQANC